MDLSIFSLERKALEASQRSGEAVGACSGREKSIAFGTHCPGIG